MKRHPFSFGLGLLGVAIAMALSVCPGTSQATLYTSKAAYTGDWANVTSPAAQIIGGQWQVALPQATNGSAFYRLSK